MATENKTEWIKGLWLGTVPGTLTNEEIRVWEAAIAEYSMLVRKSQRDQPRKAERERE